MKEEIKVEIIEYWNKKMPLYEIMLGSEYDKKIKDEPYSVLHRSETAPYVEFTPNPENELWFRKVIPYEEALQKFGEIIKLAPK